uniref:R-spondin 4 n=1 Tax=Sander lucioperca TaxID=283035 RepID=A0A8C9XJA6_SANLU
KKSLFPPQKYVIEHSHRETSEDCRSCLECSRDNGCVRCPERLFLLLHREGMSHHGTCLHACPAGHYGQRGKDINRCMKCRSLDCEHCFSRDFCTKCKPGFQLYKGKCLTRCPGGTFAHQTDCVECIFISQWSDWSICLRDGVPCGFRWGKQTRTRGRVQSGRQRLAASSLLRWLPTSVNSLHCLVMYCIICCVDTLVQFIMPSGRNLTL